MKQVLQNLSDGVTNVVDAPAPQLRPGTVLIATQRSLISAGTERSLLEFGRAGLLEKARMQPERVRMVLERVRVDGLLPTIEAVRSKLDQPLALGYCNLGRVIAIGDGVSGISVGDRVVSNGPHAEIVRVPANLCAKVPDGVADEDAPFAVTASIALQGIRLAEPTLGETFVVIGLGLIGLLAVQLLRANGCKVLGADLDQKRLALAEALGATPLRATDAEDLEKSVATLTRARGADGVLITASTQSNEPVRTAARICRKRGRIVLVGVAGLELSRADFYEKELSFQVSCSYGPGRYDPSYEEKGHDYPIGYVRWTEQRNFEAVLEMMAAGRVQTKPLITHRFPIEEAQNAYEALAQDGGALGIILTYSVPAESPQQQRLVSLKTQRVSSRASSVRAGFIGAGNYASRVLMPSFKESRIELHTLVTTGSAQGVHYARKFDFVNVATDTAAVLDNPDINLVVIATRHDSHAQLASAALSAGKHVLVEKPLAIKLEDVHRVESALSSAHAQERGASLTVGFNRRFAPLVTTICELLARRDGPKAFIYTVNAGAIPPQHWTQDAATGGGRIIGEACHFIDLLRFLAGSSISSVSANAMRTAVEQSSPDTATVQMSFEDGSIGTIHYYANGSRAFPKERLEIFMAGSVLRLDNFRKLESFGWPGFRGRRSWKLDKGQVNMVQALKRAIAAGEEPIIPAAQIFEVARATIQCAETLERA